MSRVLRWAGKGLAAILVFLLLAAALIWLISARMLSSASALAPERLDQPTAAELADASRHLRTLGCLNCHGDQGEGEKFIDEPGIATVYAPNLTLLAAKASDQQLDGAIRHGVGTDGRALVIMPSEGYQFLTDREVAALIAALRQLPRTGEEHPARKIGPLGRIGLVSGKFQTTPKLIEAYRAAPLPDFGPQFALGRHLVETHCSQCHGPDLKGKEAKPGVMSADLAIAGAYDLDQFRALLQKGIAPGNKDIGMMAGVARSDFSKLTDAEIAAIHAYLAERAQKTD